MTTLRHSFSLAGLLLLSLSPAGAAERQYYATAWQKQGGYYYRQYYHKTSADSPSHFYHLTIYYPSRPRYIYFYNPYTERYWGRYDCVAGGYSRLAERDQRQKISDIDEASFPGPGPMPFIPGSEDGVRMEPPRGLPPDESEVLSVEKMEQLVSAAGMKEAPRQIYSDWCRQGSYYWCCYFYQPVAGGAYRSQRVIWYPANARFVWFYNPQTGKYWGRYDIQARGYSLLAEKDRSDRLASIPESAFPRPGPMPPIPEAADDVKILPPPGDLPE